MYIAFHAAIFLTSIALLLSAGGAINNSNKGAFGTKAFYALLVAIFGITFEIVHFIVILF